MSNIYINFFDKLANTNHDTINYMEYEMVLNNILNANLENTNDDILDIYKSYKCNRFPPIETLKNIINNSNTIDELYIVLTDYIKLADYVD